MTKLDYNGWHNYETWLVKLWIDNEEADQNHWNRAAKEAIEAAQDVKSVAAGESFTIEERAALLLAERMKAEFEEQLPELDGFLADLMNSAFEEINFHEIAAHIVQEVTANA